MAKKDDEWPVNRGSGASADVWDISGVDGGVSDGKASRTDDDLGRVQAQKPARRRDLRQAEAPEPKPKPKREKVKKPRRERPEREVRERPAAKPPKVRARSTPTPRRTERARTSPEVVRASEMASRPDHEAPPTVEEKQQESVRDQPTGRRRRVLLPVVAALVVAVGGGAAYSSGVFAGGDEPEVEDDLIVNSMGMPGVVRNSSGAAVLAVSVNGASALSCDEIDGSFMGLSLNVSTGDLPSVGLESVDISSGSWSYGDQHESAHSPAADSCGAEGQLLEVGSQIFTEGVVALNIPSDASVVHMDLTIEGQDYRWSWGVSEVAAGEPSDPPEVDDTLDPADGVELDGLLNGGD